MWIISPRNKLWLYNEQMTLNDKPKPFAKTYAKWVEFTDGMAQQVDSLPPPSPCCGQVLEYQTNLVATVVLSDPQGQDWAGSKSYRDGESVRGTWWWGDTPDFLKGQACKRAPEQDHLKFIFS